MRKAIGFLVLAAVVVAGIVFVERGLDPGSQADAASARSMTLVLGGDPRPRAKASPRLSVASERTARPSERPARGPGEARPPGPPSLYRHVVRRGEVLSRIVEEYLGTAAPDVLRRVARDSELEDPDRIRPGTRLVLRPKGWREAAVREGETLVDVARRALGSPRRVAALRHANPHLAALSDHDPLPAGTVVWVPVAR